MSSLPIGELLFFFANCLFNELAVFLVARNCHFGLLSFREIYPFDGLCFPGIVFSVNCRFGKLCFQGIVLFCELLFQLIYHFAEPISTVLPFEVSKFLLLEHVKYRKTYKLYVTFILADCYCRTFTSLKLTMSSEQKHSCQSTFIM